MVFLVMVIELLRIPDYTQLLQESICNVFYINDGQTLELEKLGFIKKDDNIHKKLEEIRPLS